MILFRVLRGIDVVIAAAVAFFFFWGLVDGSVSSFNIGIWVVALAAVATLLGGGIALQAHGRRALGSFALAVLAAPGVLYGLFVLLFLVMQPDWK